MTQKVLNVLVVDDSAFMRLLISDILSEDEGINVIGSAVDGKEAAMKVKEMKPDVVVLDLMMEEYDGLYAVRKIMKENPCPILILSAVGNSNLEPIFDALNLGAVDYINKPSRGGSKIRQMDLELINKVKSVARAQPKVLKDLSENLKPSRELTRKKNYDIIVIGASTGGPSAIEQVVTSLPANLPVPVVIAQHMPANFVRPFVARLDTMSPLKVVVGTKSMIPTPGMVIVSPGDANMILEQDKRSKKTIVTFSTRKYPEFNNPSINALMLSVAKLFGHRIIGVILTGMGKDGVEGLKAIRDLGGYTIAQNKSSSVIFGMPKVALERGAAIEAFDIKEIGDFLVKKLKES